MANKTIYITPAREEVWTAAAEAAIRSGVSLSTFLTDALASALSTPTGGDETLAATWIPVSAPLYVMHLGAVADPPGRNSNRETWESYLNCVRNEGYQLDDAQRVYAITPPGPDGDVWSYLTATGAERLRYVVSGETAEIAYEAACLRRVRAIGSAQRELAARGEN